ncbi:MAG: hypothetical protein VXV97_02190, partial [Pseudomonadota bacterium]|nr:hypothetical protein [Pseudomonadota bacterium]
RHVLGPSDTDEVVPTALVVVVIFLIVAADARADDERPWRGPGDRAHARLRRRRRGALVGLVGVKERGIDGPEDLLKWRETIERYADL